MDPYIHDLLNGINQLRRNLYVLATTRSLTDEEVVTISHELDKLVNLFHLSENGSVAPRTGQ